MTPARTRNAALEAMIGRILTENHYTIACAESCTGGLLTSRLTDVPGSSVYVKGSIISYTNEVKINLLNVNPKTIEKFEVTSKETAIEMAEGVRNLLKTNIGVGITGIAGPTGSTEKSPVGFVYMAIAGSNGSIAEEYHLMGNRQEIKWQATEAALMMIRTYLLENSTENI